MASIKDWMSFGGVAVFMSALVIARPARAAFFYQENVTEAPLADEEGLADVHGAVIVALAVALILAGCAVAFYFAKFEAATGFASGGISALIGAVLVQASYSNTLTTSQWLYVYTGTAFVGGVIGRCMFYCWFTQVALVICTITLFDTIMMVQLGIVAFLTAPWSIYLVISLLLIVNGLLAIVFLDLMKLLTGTSTGAVMVSYGFAYFANPEASRTTFFLAGRGKPLNAYSCELDLVCYAAFLAGLITFIVSSSLHWHVREKAEMKKKRQKEARGNEEKRTRFIRTVIPYKEGGAYV